MGRYCIAQGTLLMCMSVLNEMEIQKRADVCICTADSFCCTLVANLQSQAQLSV